MASPLTMPPPPPAQVGTPGPPSLGGLAGGGQPDAGQPSDQSLQIVTQHLMEAEQALQAAARIKPELSAIIDKFMNEVKPQAGQILFGSGSQPGATGGGNTPPGPGLGMLASGVSPGQNMKP